MRHVRRSSAGIIAIAVVVAILDAAVKSMVTRWVGPEPGRQPVWLIEDVLGFTYGENSGVAFGLLRGHPEVVAPLLAFAVIGMALVLPRLMDSGRLSTLGAGLIAGGAAGNMLDRVRFGHVRDFVAVGPWPPFNLADAALTVGVGLLGLALLLGERGRPVTCDPIGSEG